MGAKKWCPFFFFEEDGRPKNKKKIDYGKFKIEFLKKVKEKVSKSQNFTCLSPMGVPHTKKKMGGRWAMCQNVPTK